MAPFSVVLLSLLVTAIEMKTLEPEENAAETIEKSLDPAGPYFENTDPTVRLDPTDALFVDAIHTDSESLIQFGTAEVVACNHFRAIHFFMESVNSPCPFMGYACVTEDDFTSGRCNSCGTAGCAYMGLHADKNIPPRGQSRKIFFTTAAHRPFCQYHLDINVKLSAGTGQTERGQLFAVFTGDKGSTEKIQLNE
ncbi:inactive pancreatic lipase-related protein 1, partial [Biomphalaria glabrata]